MLRYFDLFLNDNIFNMVLGKGGISELSSLTLNIHNYIRNLHLYILIWMLTVTVFSNDLGSSVKNS